MHAPASHLADTPGPSAGFLRGLHAQMPTVGISYLIFPLIYISFSPHSSLLLPGIISKEAFCTPVALGPYFWKKTDQDRMMQDHEVY